METQELMVRAAWLYYVEGLTQAQIGERMDLTRRRINELLAAALEQGLVRIGFNSPLAENVELEERLRERFHLVDAVVVPTPMDPAQMHAVIGRAAAAFLDRLIQVRRPGSIGVGWGATLHETARQMATAHQPDIRVRSLMGGLTRGSEINTFDIVRSFARVLNAKCQYFAAPIYAGSEEAHAVVMAQPVWRAFLREAADVDLSFLSVGDVTGQSLQVRYGLPAQTDIGELVSCGAVGDILGRYIDAQGVPVDHPVNRQVISPDLADYRRIPIRIVASGGSHKHAVLLAALRAGLATSVVTDADSVRAICNIEHTARSAADVFRRCRTGLITVGVASALINLLYLTSSFFMLQVYDRVIPSRSIPTLVVLSLLALMLYFFQGAFELARSRMLTRISGVLDERLGGRVFKAVVRTPIKGNGTTDGLALMRDFDQVKSFLSSSGPPAFFDLPWLPVYIVICFLFHPVIGIIAIVGATVLTVLTYLTNRATQASSKKLYEVGGERGTLLGAAHRNAEVVAAMGMADDLSRSWSHLNDDYRQSHRRNADVANGYATASKIFRIVLQSGVLAAGAVLVIENQASGGIIIAASILTSRALAPVEQAIANWRGFVSAQQSWRRLHATLDAMTTPLAPISLAAPEKSLVVEGLASAPPGRSEIVIANIGFKVEAGDAVGVIGPSASGKSSLARALAGIWPIHRGSVRLDGATLDQWNDADRGRHIGYLPQDIELFSGTVAENISRFREDATSEQIIHAAKMAGVHDLILQLADGYATEIGASGSMLSAGQRQRIALARALFGEPFLVILDEPNSNLDAEGEGALSQAIINIRKRGGIAIVIAHRPSALAGTNFVLTMNGGRVAAFGERDEVLAKVLRREPAPGEHPRHMLESRGRNPGAKG
eukprot:g9870.t1